MKTLLAVVISLYAFSAAIALPYYNWRYGQEHGFFAWLILGEFVATGKALTWPYWMLMQRAENQKAEQVQRIAEERHLADLDSWARGGGSMDQVQSRVTETCGKLTVLKMTTGQRNALMSTDKETTDEFHFRVDVCVKMTVNRIHPQPEFKKPEIVTSTCGQGGPAHFRRLCDRSGFAIR